MNRSAKLERTTSETSIKISLNIDGKGKHEISSGIPFFDHMLTLFTVHGFMDLKVSAKGDLNVDDHHTVEDIGLVLGEVLNNALGDRKKIKRYGHASTPMDETLTIVTLDLSNRPYLVYNVLSSSPSGAKFNIQMANEFFRAFINKAGISLHVNVMYGNNEHHIIESIFKSFGRALDQAVSYDERIQKIQSTKGIL